MSRSLRDPGTLWDKTDLRNRMLWLIKSGVHESKLLSSLKSKWEDLSFEVQVAIGIKP